MGHICSAMLKDTKFNKFVILPPSTNVRTGKSQKLYQENHDLEFKGPVPLRQFFRRLPKNFQHVEKFAQTVVTIWAVVGCHRC